MIRRFFRQGAAALVAATLLTAPAQAEGLTDMTDEERAAFREEVRAYLLENPEVIFEAIQILEAQRQLAAAQQDAQTVLAHADALMDDGYSFVGGNPDGDVTVVEFLDYRCGYCKRAHPHVIELLERDPNVRLVEKQFPILGPESVAAAKVAMGALALDPETYPAFTDALMGFRGQMSENVALRIAGNLGYDIAELKAAAADPAIEEQINQTYALAQLLGIQGTPTFIVGTEVIRGYLPVDDLQAAVEDARAALN